MGRPRMELQRLFKKSTPHVYFQPPDSLDIEYPCIIYNLEDIDTQYADNSPYRESNRYMVTVIDSDPDSVIRNDVKSLPLCSFNRFFTADNLNHFAFTLYF